MFVDLPTKWEAVLFGAAVLHFVIAYAIEQTNPLLAMFVDFMNLKMYNWYHKKFKRRFDFEEYRDNKGLNPQRVPNDEDKLKSI